MRFSLLLASALFVAAPGAALAADPHHAHSAGPAAKPVAHSQKQVTAKGLKATFHFNAPTKAAYTCAMHPEVVSQQPGTCQKCGGMKLVKQTHHIAVLESTWRNGETVHDFVIERYAERTRIRRILR